MEKISKEEYRDFLDNNEQLAATYGKNTQLFLKNKADIDFERMKYVFVKRNESIESSEFEEQMVITINNPFGLRIRPEKQIAEVLGHTRSKVKSLMEKGEIIYRNSAKISVSMQTPIQKTR